MGKICLIFMTVFLAAACISEVTPILKPTEFDIATRIVNQQKWLDEDVASKAISRENALPIQKRLYEIKEKYNRLQAAGPLTAKDSAAINRTLDEISDAIFRVKPPKQHRVF